MLWLVLQTSFVAVQSNHWHSTLHTASCTQHNAHCTLHTTHCTLHTEQCTLHTALCKPYTAHFKLPTAQWTLNTAHCSLNSAHWTMHTEHQQWQISEYLSAWQCDSVTHWRHCVTYWHHYSTLCPVLAQISCMSCLTVSHTGWVIVTGRQHTGTHYTTLHYIILHNTTLHYSAGQVTQTPLLVTRSLFIWPVTCPCTW